MGGTLDAMSEPPHESSRAAWPWWVAVLLIVLLSVDVWAWGSDARLLPWLPSWVAWAIGLQLALAAALYGLGRRLT